MGLEDISLKKQNKSLREAAGTSKTLQVDLVEVHKKRKICTSQIIICTWKTIDLNIIRKLQGLARFLGMF